MNRFKISTRVSLLAGALSLLVLAIGLLGQWGIAQANADLRVLYEERLAATARMGQIQSLLLRNRLALAAALVTPVPEQMRASADEVETNIAAITRIWDEYKADHRDGLADGEQRLAQDFARHRQRFVQEGLQPAVAALRAQQPQRAQQLVLEAVRPLYEPVGAGIAALVDLQREQARMAYEAAEARYATIPRCRWRPSAAACCSRCCSAWPWCAASPARWRGRSRPRNAWRAGTWAAPSRRRGGTRRPRCCRRWR